MNKKIATVTIVGAILTGGAGLTADQMQNPYTDKTTHYELSVASDVMQGDKVEVSKDEPKLTLSRWNDEARITIEPVFHGAGKVSKSNRPLMSKKLEYKKGDMTAFIEPKEGSDSEFDIDFILDSKPASNVFEYKITGAEEYDFFYQPDLRGEEGIKQPENVVGSYAVYHKTKKNYVEGQTNYGIGKIMHIYRPKAIDANGNEVWAELNYEKGILSVTVPQDFLNNASYPITVDPTIGYTSIGLSAVGSNNVTLRGITVNGASSGGAVSSIQAYGKSGATSRDIQFAIYDTSSNLLSPQSSTVTVNSSTQQWWIATFTGPTLSVGTDYWPAVISASGSTGDTFQIYADFGAGTEGRQKSSGLTFPVWENPATWTNSVIIFSLYATYTAAGGGTTPSITSDFIEFN